jgi:hypothetical protein
MQQEENDGMCRMKAAELFPAALVGGSESTGLSDTIRVFAISLHCRFDAFCFDEQNPEALTS